MKRYSTCYIAFFSAILFCSSAYPAVKLETVLQEVQSVWDKTKTFTAPFKQSVESKLMGNTERTEGIILVVKPDRFRWESKTDGTIQIINKKLLTLVQPKAQRGRTVVDIYPNFAKKADARVLDFLAGNVQIKKLYKPKLLDQKGNFVRLELTPLGKKEETYIAEIDKKSYLLHALTYETEETKTRLEFHNPKVNQTIDEKLFEYTPGKEDIVNRAY
ncbi:MAG: outer membrane lipoprotein carrier protein LolA [Bdellovibrionales bacterium]|nr:outer membrane lipoprotein carrier protein LolA [Bdellovibrionales bacterium]